MQIFESVKSRLTMREVAGYYGVNVDRSGMALCPFHHEKTPSAKIYPDSFHCFGCGEHADVIGFVEKMFSLSPIEAAKKLNDDFCLNLDIGKAPTRTEKTQFVKRADERKEYEKWDSYAWNCLHDYLWLMRDWKERHAPLMPNIPVDRRYVYACHHLGYAEYLCNVFFSADQSGRLAMKREVESTADFLRQQVFY